MSKEVHDTYYSYGTIELISLQVKGVAPESGTISIADVLRVVWERAAQQQLHVGWVSFI